MPLYSFLNLKTKKIEDIYFHMAEAPSIGAEILNDNNEKVKRIALKPNASIDTNFDPFSQKDFVKVTNKQGETFGSLWDKSKEFSEKRKEKEGIDPVKEKFNKKREKDYGLVNMDKKKEKAAANLKKIGVTLKEKNEKR